MSAELKRRMADDLIKYLAPVCTRLELAGALRRGAPDPKDIDIVCVPVTERQLDLFGSEQGETTIRFGIRMAEAEERFGLRWVRSGDRLTTYDVPALGCTLDLFKVRPPAQWGAILAIRTGPSEFSNLCVTSRLQGGAMPTGMREIAGHLERNGEVVQTPHEDAWFEALGLPWWRPEERTVERLREELKRQRQTARR